MPLRRVGDREGTVFRRVKRATEEGSRIEGRNSGIPPESPGKAAFSRAPVERMQRLHEMLSANRYPNCRKIAAEFEVSTKTIQRDVNFMRDRLRLPIEYDGRHTGFRYSRPVDDPPIAFASEIAKAKKSAPAKEVATDFSILDSEEWPCVKECGAAIARIWFDAKVAARVQVLASHPFQEIKISPDGGVELKVQLDGVVDLDRWVLSWGAYARVLEPDWLRRRILKIARRILASYRNH